MFKAVVFDLDNCLSAANEVGVELFEPMFDAIRRENRGRLAESVLAAAFHDCWYHALDFVAARHGFSDAMLAAGWAVGKNLEVARPMIGYPDLSLLAELPLRRFLVTSGFRRLQESKIKALGIAPVFEAIFVDAIDDPERQGKQAIFAEILRAYSLEPGSVLVVGDNPDSEIEAGNNLGMPTVQILRPEVKRGTNAVYVVEELKELKSLATASGGNGILL